MQKVLILSTFRKPGGGPQGYTWNLEKGLASKKHSFVFWSFYNVSQRILPKSQLANLNNSFTFLKQLLIFISWLKQNLFALLNFKLLNELRRSNCIVVHDQSFLFIVLLSKCIGVKVYYMQHTPTSWTEEVMSMFSSCKVSGIFKWFLTITERSHFTLADYCIVPSLNSINSYDDFNVVKKDFVLQKSIFIPSGAPKLTSNNSKKSNDKLNIAFFGRYHEHKGFDIFLDLASSLVNYNDIHFYCAGSGNITVKDTSNLTNLGWIEDVGSAMVGMDIIICPNRFTYFDLLPLEVLSIGRILILSNSGGNVDLAKYSKGIFLVEKEDLSQYRDCILMLKNEFSVIQRNELMDNNKSVYEEYFTLESFADRYIKTFQK